MAFLNQKIDNDNIYMDLPDGMHWVDERIPKGAKVHLLKALYGLKQSPCLWYQAINAFLLSLGLKQSSADPNLYVKDGVLLLLYVDDILIVNTSDDSPSSSANQVIMALKTKYKISDLGKARYFLGLEINRDENGISLSQESYIDTMIKRFGMDNGATSQTHLTLMSDLKMRNVRITPLTEHYISPSLAHSCMLY
jgi:hypothetical protein